MPFAALADVKSHIHWPPSGEVALDVTGFDDAARCAHRVIIRHNPTVRIPVASTPGLRLLKLIAWGDRSADVRVKDALDLAYLIDNYERVEQVGERLYDIEGLMARYDTAAIAGPGAKARIVTVLENNLQEETPNHLIEEMCARPDDEYEKRLSLMGAFANGFNTGR